MRHVIYGLTLTMITILVITVVSVVSGKTTRSKESNDSLNIAVDNSIDLVLDKQIYKSDASANIPMDELSQQLVVDILENLLYSYENDADIEIQIVKTDVEKGLVAIKVIQHYINANGLPGTYEVERVIALEKNAVKEKYYELTYLDEIGTIYKQFTLTENSKFILPEYENSPTGFKFVNENGTVTDNTIYTANQLKNMTVIKSVILQPVK